MALFEEQITDTLETGAPSIKYTGKEGPRPSMQSQEEMMMARQIWDAMGDEEKGQFSNFEEFFASGIWKQILQQMQQDEGQGQGIAGLRPQGPQGQPGIASLGPRNMEQMPNRMGAQYGGRIGYRHGKDMKEAVRRHLRNPPLTEYEKEMRIMSREERESDLEMFRELLRLKKIPHVEDIEKKDLLHWDDEYTMGHRAMEYSDDPVFEEFYETGEHFNRGGRTGIESLRGRR